MTATFGEAALRIGAALCGGLGWRPAELWSATPAEAAMALGIGANADAAVAATAADLTRMQAEMGDDG
ncbi:MAG: phage tail assembly chaperone [Alphaproteobacteria bacterium]|nr:phage tail assembly chaperone [Alphaproteobacteria bacterium]